MSADMALVQAIREGVVDAFSVVVERFQGRIARYLHRLVGDRQLAEDLTQETFYSAYKAICRTNSQLTLGPWLYRIATNHAYMHFRRQRLVRWLPFLEHLHSGTAPPADAALAQQDQVQRALTSLPPDYAVALVLHMVEGFKHQEVGDILGISAEAARKRVARGSAMFRSAFEREEVGSK